MLRSEISRGSGQSKRRLERTLYTLEALHVQLQGAVCRLESKGTHLGGTSAVALLYSNCVAKAHQMHNLIESYPEDSLDEISQVLQTYHGVLGTLTELQERSIVFAEDCDTLPQFPVRFEAMVESMPPRVFVKKSVKRMRPRRSKYRVLAAGVGLGAIAMTAPLTMGSSSAAAVQVLCSALGGGFVLKTLSKIK